MNTKVSMKKISLNGRKADFSYVLANWLVKDAKNWSQGQEPDDTVPNWHMHEFREAMGDRSAKDLLKILQTMVRNRTVFEIMIAFSARYRSAVMKAKPEDVQEALDLIKVMEVHQK